MTEQTVTDWMEVRTAKKARNTKTALLRIQKEIEKAKEYGFTAEDCIFQSASKSWIGFEAGYIVPELSTNVKKVEPKGSEENTEGGNA